MASQDVHLDRPSAPGVAHIELSRLDGQRDKLGQYRIIVDGEDVGGVAENQKRHLTVTPGEHRVHLRISRWWRSAELAVSIPAGEVANLVCRSSGLGLHTEIFHRKRYISLATSDEGLPPQRPWRKEVALRGKLFAAVFLPISFIALPAELFNHAPSTVTWITGVGVPVAAFVGVFFFDFPMRVDRRVSQGKRSKTQD